MTLALYPDQACQIPLIREPLRQCRAVLFCAPCGWGKTAVFSHIAAEIARRNKRVLILVHRDFLVDQVRCALLEWGIVAGVICAGWEPYPESKVQVASVFTLIRRMTQVGDYDLIIADEAHHCADGNSWFRILEAFPKAKVLGVTASPCRADGRGLGKTFQDLVVGPSVREMIDVGRLSDYRLFAPDIPDLSHIKTVAGDYKNDDLSEAVDRSSIIGSAVEHYQKHAAGKRAVAFAVNIKHSQHIRDQFLAAGIPAEHLDGRTTADDRRFMLKRFSEGRTLVLSSVGVISEGFDLPAVEAALILRPTKSLALHIQMTGRALRRFPGKERAIILDHAANSETLGFPDDPRDWSLDDDAKRKPSKVNIKICPACFAAVRSHVRICPECGYIWTTKTEEVEHAEGELVEVDRQARQLELALAVAKENDDWRRKRSEVESATTIAELRRIAAERNYKRGWAMHVARAKGITL